VTIPLIFDSDGGVDDAAALWHICTSPAFELLAVTVVAGNVGLEQAAVKLATILHAAGHPHVPTEQALVTATSAAAELLAIDDEVGTLAPGLHGDVIVVDGDPLSDIGALRRPGNIVEVIKAGRIVARPADGSLS
jgi:adenine deaminase